MIATTAAFLLAVATAHGIGIVDSDTAAIDFVATHRADDLLSICFLDLEEGKAWKQVDLTDLHAPRDALIDQLNELVGEHTVELTEVDEEALHPLLGHGIALVALLAFLAFAREAALVIGLLDRLFALVVVEQATVLEEHQSAYKLLAVDPVELTDQLGEHGVERRVFGELDTLDAVCQVEELLLTDSLTRGEVLTLDGGM